MRMNESKNHFNKSNIMIKIRNGESKIRRELGRYSAGLIKKRI